MHTFGESEVLHINRSLLRLAHLLIRSLHNIRIERLWREIRRMVIEGFRRTFQKLEEDGLLDIENPLHRTVLFLVYQPRIQSSLNRAQAAYNHHTLRTEHAQTPLAIVKLSRAEAIIRGYWTGDPGDAVEEASGDYYGCDGQAPLPSTADLEEDPDYVGAYGNLTEEEEQAEGIRVNKEDELGEAREVLKGFDLQQEDEEWGMSVYAEALSVLEDHVAHNYE